MSSSLIDPTELEFDIFKRRLAEDPEAVRGCDILRIASRREQLFIDEENAVTNAKNIYICSYDERSNSATPKAKRTNICLPYS